MSFEHLLHVFCKLTKKRILITSYCRASSYFQHCFFHPWFPGLCTSHKTLWGWLEIVRYPLSINALSLLVLQPKHQHFRSIDYVFSCINCCSLITESLFTDQLTAALNYFDGYRTARLPANLLQAQRDYFGAHTYERTDKPRGEFFHTNWTGRGGNTSSSTYNA